MHQKHLFLKQFRNTPMSSIEKTAYPRFLKKRKIKSTELSSSYSLRDDEIKMINLAAKTDKSRFNLAIQLKAFQRLGYFTDMDKIPSEIIIHIRQSLKYHYRLAPGYGDNNKSIYRHRQKIREFLNVKRWGYDDVDGKKIHQGMKLAIQYAYDASQSMNNIPDIINAVIEQLVQASYELPSFYRLSRIVRHTRHSVNNKIFRKTMKRILASNQSEVFSNLLKLQDGTQRTLFNQLKNLPKRPSIQKFQKFLDHFQWLLSFGNIMHDGQSINEHTDFAKAFYQKIEDDGGFSLLTNKCDDILASHGNEYRIYLTDMIQKRRSLLFKILNALQLNSPTQDDKLILAMQYLLKHEDRRAEFITEDIDLTFTTAFWNKQIMSSVDKTKANRRALESCVFEYVSKGLNSGDLYVNGARNYADYRAELLPWEECQEHLETFCDEVGIPKCFL